ncbi:hypothetical protein M404DRAFT_537986 [Pisolithus tinctorius Marx 270]|uniref:Uncharacterized protein n=1 Tax=Pisolithus tinctorius Marx 270 TaxID=870435 RepID=A0A0C3PA17_PISTI|nr:hypothetical protein M404DRAFT_537986 [Pisolithus tinctorius Marx 270]
MYVYFKGRIRVKYMMLGNEKLHLVRWAYNNMEWTLLSVSSSQHSGGSRVALRYEKETISYQAIFGP